jgi:hypothetical protein
VRGRNPKPDTGQNPGLVRRDGHDWRLPVCESCPTDNYTIRNSWPDIVELEKSIVVCYCGVTIAWVWTCKDNLGDSNGVAVYIRYGTDNATRLDWSKLFNLPLK